MSEPTRSATYGDDLRHLYKRLDGLGDLPREQDRIAEGRAVEIACFYFIQQHRATLESLMLSEIGASRNAVIEECAKVCDAEIARWGKLDSYNKECAEMLAFQIRALKSEPLAANHDTAKGE